MGVEMIQAIGNLGALPLLGFLLYQAIKIRRNGNGRLNALEKKVDQLVISVARIEGHLEVKKGGKGS
ncbi:MAG: hypothetical protein JSV16_13340 [Candidatus Hydrogenedentota bacterium]|nr:MAG: hypothetical protein JSV16_13340 [Candidatus Hydrogenedentota bacterium]